MSSTLLFSAAGKPCPKLLHREVAEYFDAGARVDKANVVVDVGANVGAFSLFVAERCHGDVRLLCFEPAPPTFALLEKNFSRHAMLRRTHHSLYPLGLSSLEKAGDAVPFFHFSRFATNSTFELAQKRREFELFFEQRAKRWLSRWRPLAWLVGKFFESAVWRVPLWVVMQRVTGLVHLHVATRTLASILKDDGVQHIDLLKIDVEGAELDVLRGLDDGTWDRVQQIVLETGAAQVCAIEQLLRDHGFANIKQTPQRTIDNGLNNVILVAQRKGRDTATSSSTASRKNASRVASRPRSSGV
jgi:FkbM family methyltransferase